MRAKFVQTENVSRFLAAVASLDDRAAPEACFCLAQGEAGFGKTRAAKWWALQEGAVFLRLQEAMTPSWMLRDLVTELGEQVPAYSTERLFQQACELLARDLRPLVVDEAERGVKNIRLLETIRDLSDLLEFPVILVGREFMWAHIKRHPQLKTRVSARAAFSAASLADVTKMAEELCEVPVAEEVLKTVHKKSEGHVREIVKALKQIEKIGRRNGGALVTPAAIDGVTLCQDEPRRVRKAA